MQIIYFGTLIIVVLSYPWFYILLIQPDWFMVDWILRCGTCRYQGMICTMSFYIRDLSSCGFWYQVWGPGTNTLWILRDDCTKFKSINQSSATDALNVWSFLISSWILFCRWRNWYTMTLNYPRKQCQEASVLVELYFRFNLRWKSKDNWWDT